MDQVKDGVGGAATPLQGDRSVESSSTSGPPLETAEDLARALREAEERTARLLGRLRQLSSRAVEGGRAGEGEEEEDEDDEDDEDSDEDSEDLDVDNMSYEELIALGEAMGTQSKGLSATTIASLPVSPFKLSEAAGGGGSSDSEQCVICRHEYEEEEQILTLPCKHRYHSQCIHPWLQINKVCPVCNAEVAPF